MFRVSTRHLVALVVCTSTHFACSDGEVPCFDDRSCDLGQRCEIPKIGAQGVCVACDAEETPYDGIDNDCSARTPDRDLDQDGDNWADAPIAPGNDCDDENDMVSSRMSEVCEDNLDNDCDGEVDELDCGDRAAPSVAFLAPVDGALLTGSITVTVEVSDDVRVSTLRLAANDVELASREVGAPMGSYDFEVDTRSLPDGRINLRAEVTDISDKQDSAVIAVRIDNTTPPMVNPVRPVSGGSYAGRMTVELQLDDAQGIGEISLRLDDRPFGDVLTGTTAPTWTIFTSTLTEGSHILQVTASDQAGNTGDTTIPFRVDRTPPMANFDSPSEDEVIAGDTRIRVSANDPAGIREIAFRDARSAPGETILDANYDVSELPNEFITLEASAIDGTIVDDGAGIGNATTVTVDVRVSNPLPLIEIVELEDGDQVRGLTRVLTNYNRPDGGAALLNLAYLVDGNQVSFNRVGDLEAYIDFSPFVGQGQVQLTARLTVIDQLTSDVGFIDESVTVEVVPAPPMELPTRVNVPDIVDIEVADLNGDGVQDVFVAGRRLIYYQGTIVDGTWHVGGVAHYFSFPEEVSANSVFVAEDPASGSPVIFLDGPRRTRIDPMGEIEEPVDDMSGLTFSGEIATGDFNGDGIVDFARASGSSCQFAFGGPGGFSPGPSVPIGSGGTVQAAEAVELDGDGPLELAVLIGGQAQFLDWNEMAMNFVPSTPVGQGTYGRSFGIGELTGDGIVDVGIWGADLSDPLDPKYYWTVLRGDGQGVPTLSTESRIRLPDDFSFGLVGVEDLTGDGSDEVLFGSGEGFYVWENPGTQGPTTAVLWETLPGDPTLADMNNDGILDVVTAQDFVPDLFTIAHGQPNNTFYAPRRYNQSGLGRLAPYQTSTSTIVEMIMGGRDLWRSTVLPDGSLGPPSRLWTSPGSPQDGVTSIAVGNLDGMGDPEIVFTHEVGTAFTLDLNSSATPFASDNYSQTLVRDLNGDALPEVILRTGIGRLSVWDPRSMMPTELGSTTGVTQDIVVADLDGGASDGLDVGYLGDAAGIFRSTSGVWTANNFPHEVSGWQLLAGRFDGDAFTDLVVVGTRLLLMSGSPGAGFFEEPVELEDFPSDHGVVRDFNGDGLEDLILFRNGEIAVFYQRANGGLSAPMVGRTPSYDGVLIEDLTGDGQPDVMLRRSGSYSLFRQRSF